jgi:Zn-dependent protease
MTVLLPIATVLLFGFPVLAAKPVPFNPGRVKYGEFGAALIALAGPVTNLILALLGGFAFEHLQLSGFMSNFLDTFTVLNVSLFVFNMIPIPPLDGSRVLFAFAPEGLQRIMSDIEPYGLIIVFALVLGFGFNGFLQNVDQFILNLI